MPDPVGIYFKLQAVDPEDPDNPVDFPIYQASTRLQSNYVKLVRSGPHEIQFTVSHEDAVTLMGKKYVGPLEAHIFDNSRVADGGDEVDIRIYPLVPWRAEYITNKVVKITFKQAVGGTNEQDWYNDVWDASGYVELTDVVESPAMTIGPERLQEYLTSDYIRVDEFSGYVNGSWANAELHADVTPTVKTAVDVGFHNFRRPATRWQNLRVWESLCGVVYWWDTEDRTIHLAMADEDQPDLDTFKDPDYLVEDYPNLENGQPRLVVHSDNYFIRTSFYESRFGSYPVRIIADGLGLSVPALYRVTPVGIRQNHYSSLILAPLRIDNLSGGGLAATQQLIDDHAATYQRAVKATERTYAAYHRASRRTDWYRLKGFHNVSLGSEVASVTYKNQSTIVDFRDQRSPVWPSLPMLATPTMSLLSAVIQVKNPILGSGSPTFLGWATSPHEGYWSVPKSMGYNRWETTFSLSLELEDSLKLFPWLDVGDRVLCFWDGSRAVIIQAELAADVELQ